MRICPFRHGLFIGAAPLIASVAAVVEAAEKRVPEFYDG